ncbi:MAG: hypothetical protein HZB16_08950 [Armatimonadetes bacterium]|nr:hypothetical protein [Armatimonadota bacterium]
MAMDGPLSHYAFWQRLVSGLTHQALHGISQADYGNDAGAHLAALEVISSAGVVPVPLEWEPREVLELTLWGADSLDCAEHAQAVLFAGVVLATTEVVSPDRGPESHALATALLQSVTFLGGCWVDELLVWLRDLATAAYERERARGWCDNGPAAFALAGLILASRAARPPDERGWWRARIDEARNAWQELRNESVWTVFDYEWRWFVWEELMAPVHRDVVGFRPPGAAGRKQG